ncbi:MAG TPA: type II secretion system protein GspC [Desulfuromonadales bacterium]|nr:type II secretion system protein GspC [Desulfuromonadales bacterium]
MLAFFQRYFHTVQLCLIALVGLALGQLTDVETARMLTPPVRPQTSISIAPAAAEHPQLSSYQGILKRNIFDSTAKPAAVLTNVGPAAASASAPVSRVPLNLLGTVTAGPRSLALIEASHKIDIYHLDDEVPGGGHVAGIGRVQVTIRYPDGSRVDLQLYASKPAGSSHMTRPGRPVSPGAPGGTGIRALGNNRWVIPATEVEKARSNMNELLKQARLEPNIVNGQTNGFVVRMIRPHTLFTMLGLRLGDVIKQVNGVSLDSPEKALQIFQQLREAKNISISLIRNGKPQTFEYEVQ